MAIAGPPGSGKSYTALRLMHALRVLRDDPRFIGVVDTESGSAEDYADVPSPDGGTFSFLTLDLSQEPGKFSGENYEAALGVLTHAGCGYGIVDSLSHAWAGEGGMLAKVDQVAKAQRNPNGFTAWADVTPMQNRLITKMISWPGHLIATMRTKMEWVIEDNARGRKEPRKVGLAPVQRDGIEYEFTIAGSMDLGHRLVIEKSRLANVPVGSVWEKPGKDLAMEIDSWLRGRERTLEEMAGVRPLPMIDAFRAHLGMPVLAELSPVQAEQFFDWLDRNGSRFEAFVEEVSRG